MAVEKAVEYAVQTQSVQSGQSQDSHKAVATKQREKAVKTSGQMNNTSAVDDVKASGVQYDISKRTNEVAAWYQDFVRKEQEEELSLTEMMLEEEKQAKEKEEKDPIREALEKAEVIVKSLERMLERMREQQKKQQTEKKKSKGKLSYSYRKISNSISTAKTTMQASNALSSATANLSMLRRKAASGKYEEKEVQIALQHANKMVRAARKKVANLKSEAQQQKRNVSKENHKKQQNSMIHHAPARQKVEKELQQLQAELKSREKREKNRNRRDEDMDLMQADMQYLRRKIDLLKNHGLSLSTQQQQTVDDMLAAAMGFVTVELKEEAVEAAEGNQTTETASVETASAETASATGGFETTV